MIVSTGNKTLEEYKWLQMYEATWPQKGHCIKPSFWLLDLKGGRDYPNFLEIFSWWEYVKHKVFAVIKVFNSYMPKLASEPTARWNKSMRVKILLEQKKKSITLRHKTVIQGILQVNRPVETCTSRSVWGICLCCFTSLHNPVHLFWWCKCLLLISLMKAKKELLSYTVCFFTVL